MTKFKKLGITTAILFCALANPAVAQDATTPSASGRNTTIDAAGTSSDPQAKRDEQAKSKEAQPHERDGLSGRRGVSCQRDTFFKGEDGQRHLCN